MARGATKEKLHEVDPPKDDAVTEELENRQLGLFEGHQVAAIGTKLQAGEVTMNPDYAKPQAGEVRYVTAKVRLVKVDHTLKKGAMVRVNEFEVLDAEEISYTAWSEAVGYTEADAEQEAAE